MLTLRDRQRASTEPTLGQCIVLAGTRTCRVLLDAVGLVGGGESKL